MKAESRHQRRIRLPLDRNRDGSRSETVVDLRLRGLSYAYQVVAAKPDAFVLRVRPDAIPNPRCGKQSEHRASLSRILPFSDCRWKRVTLESIATHQKMK